MAITNKVSGRAASVALARKRIRDGVRSEPVRSEPVKSRAASTIPASVLSVVQSPDAGPSDAATPSGAPVSSLGRLAESQREALRRLDALERLMQRCLAEIGSLERHLISADPDAPEESPEPDSDPEKTPTTPRPDVPEQPEDPDHDPEQPDSAPDEPPPDLA